MKKVFFIVTITIGMMGSYTAFGQDENNNTDQTDETVKPPFSERKTVFYAYGFEEVHYGPGGCVGLSFRNITNAPASLSDIYVGLLSSNKVPFGIELGIHRLKKSFGETGFLKYSEKIGLQYLYKNSIFIAHDSLVANTLKGPLDKMIISIALGPNLDIGSRISIFVTFNPGISWYPNAKMSWKTNGSYDFGLSFGITGRFGGKNKENSE